MLLLSTGVAMPGLNENSAAVIIGALVFAPMGQPIIALSAALAMAWSREAARLLTIILTGAVTVAAGAFLRPAAGGSRGQRDPLTDRPGLA